MASPLNTRSLVDFTNQNRGRLSVTDRLHAHNGEIIQTKSKDDLTFMVEYQGFWFAVYVDQQGTKSHLRIHGVIGKLPYSYESTFSRANVLAVVKAAGKALGGKVHVDDKQRILLIDTLTFEGGLSPKVILAETTKVLLRVKPYLQLVATLLPPKSVSFPAPTKYQEQNFDEAPVHHVSTSHEIAEEPHQQEEDADKPHPLVANKIKLKVRAVSTHPNTD